MGGISYFWYSRGMNTQYQSDESSVTYPTSNADYTFAQRMTLIFRCVFNRCPRCGKGPICGINPLKFPDACPHCGFVFERGNGFLLAALPAVYFIYAIFGVVPMVVLFLKGVISYEVAFVLGLVGSFVVPLSLYNYCKMLAIALYYFFLPRELYHTDLQDEI